MPDVIVASFPDTGSMNIQRADTVDIVYPISHIPAFLTNRTWISHLPLLLEVTSWPMDISRSVLMERAGSRTAFAFLIKVTEISG